MKFLQGKPLHVRKRVAIIATGCIGGILVIVMILLYIHPPKKKHDPELTLMHGYTIIIGKVQSLFHHK